jgi:hypothetical protein
MRTTASAASVNEYQRVRYMRYGLVFGSPGSLVASLRSVVSLNGVLVRTIVVAFAKLSFADLA